eukprot:362220-Chlamydomonas_euryale.AAC.8
MTPMIRDQSPSSDHNPLHCTARGREAHGRDAALGRALLAERGDKGLGKCTRERETSTCSVTLGLSPAAFTLRETTCKEKTTAQRLVLGRAVNAHSRSKTVQNERSCMCGSHMFTHGLGIPECFREDPPSLEERALRRQCVDVCKGCVVQSRVSNAQLVTAVRNRTALSSQCTCMCRAHAREHARPRPPSRTPPATASHLQTLKIGDQRHALCAPSSASLPHGR